MQSQSYYDSNGPQYTIYNYRIVCISGLQVWGFQEDVKKKMSFGDFNVSITSRIGLCLHNWPNVLSCLSSKNLAYHHQPEIYTHLMRVEKHHDGCDLILGGVRGNTLGENRELECNACTGTIFWVNCVESTKGSKAGLESDVQSNSCHAERNKCAADTMRSGECFLLCLAVILSRFEPEPLCIHATLSYDMNTLD